MFLGGNEIENAVFIDLVIQSWVVSVHVQLKTYTEHQLGKLTACLSFCITDTCIWPIDAAQDVQAGICQGKNSGRLK